MQLTSAGYLKGVHTVRFFHPHGHVGLHFLKQAVPQVAGGDILALTAGQRAVVDREGHLHGGVVDLDEGQRLDLSGAAQGVADGHIRQAGEGHDIACGDVIAGLTAVCLEVVQLGQTAAHLQVGVVPVAHDHFLAHLGNTVLDAADADAAHELVVVHRGHQHLEGSLGVALGRLDGAQQSIEQGDQVGAGHIRVQAGGAVTAAAEQHGAVQLFVGSAQVHQQVQHLVDDFLDAGIGTVDLVDSHHKAQVLLQSLLQHKAGLGHAALGSVHQQQNAVDHLQHALDLAAEVGVARGVDDVDLNVLVLDRDVLGENRNAALALLVVGIQDAVLDLLVGTEGVRGTQELVDHRRLAVVDVGDDGDVSQIVYAHVVPLSSIYIQPARVCDPPSNATLGGNIEPFTENSFILAILDERGFLTCRFRVAPHKTIAGAHALIQHICRKTALERGFEEAHEQSIVIAAVNLDTTGVADGIAGNAAQALVLKTHLVLGDKVGGRLEARLFAVLVKRRQISVGSSVLDRHNYARILTGGKVVQERTNQVTHHGVELGGDVTGVLHILCHL